MKFLRFAALSVAVAVAATGNAEAQRRRGLVEVSPSNLRHGFWFFGGLSAGKDEFKFSDESRYTKAPTKPTFSIRAGGTVSPNFRIGGEITSYLNSHTDISGVRVTDYVAGLFLIGQFYPVRDAGFFIKGGGGLTRTGTSVYGGGGLSEDGFGFTVGAGYDIRLGRHVALTPTVDWFRTRSEQQGEPALLDRVLSVGVGITVQPGH